MNEGEDVVLDLHPHWWFFVGPLVALVVSVFVGVALLVVWDLESWVNIPIGLAILGSLLWFGVRYAKWATTNFVVTTDRLIYRHGVLSKHGTEIPLDRVNTVFFSLSLFERMIGAGDLTIESAGEMGHESFSNVRKPSAVQNEIYKQMESNENRKFDRINRAPAGGGGSGGGDSIPDQIAKLDALRQSGAISDAEFQAKKSQLLDRM
jgi:uncharacterized membrane protein YdbT with pleckstrin-like domain